MHGSWGLPPVNGASSLVMILMGVSHRFEVRIESCHVRHDLDLEDAKICRVAIKHWSVVLGRIEMTESVPDTLDHLPIRRSVKIDIECLNISSCDVCYRKNAVYGADLAGEQIDDAYARTAQLIRPRGNAACKCDDRTDQI
jgi:hypothetical protein